MNTTIISGRLVRNPGYNEVENEKGLHKIAKFVLAVRRNYSDEVSFIPVKAFAKKAEFARDYLMQGTKVMVEGEIVASENPSNPNDLKVTAIFTNTQRKLINIEFDKHWKDANNEDIVTTNQPDEIYIQLQRRLANSAEDAPWDVVDYPTSGSKYVTVHHTDNGWLYPFNNLDQYPVGGSAANN